MDMNKKIVTKIHEYEVEIESNVQGVIDECERIKKANKLQEGVNNEFKSNIEQIDTIKASVTLSLIHI